MSGGVGSGGLASTGASVSPGSASFSFSRYLRRVYLYSQMDFEFTMWQMVYLCFSPAKVYNTARYHKQTKNQWARDDPAFITAFLWLVVMATCAWSLAIHASLTELIVLVLWVGLIDFFIIGVTISTAMWAVANRFLLMRSPGPTGLASPARSSPARPSDVEVGSADHLGRGADHTMVGQQSVEWLYAFDIHLNSFFPLWVLLYVLQFFILIPILAYPTSFVSTFFANTLYLVAGIYYYYITFLGYTALPFLHNTQVVLYPVGGLVVLYVLSLIFNVNAAVLIINFYFGTPH